MLANNKQNVTFNMLANNVKGHFKKKLVWGGAAAVAEPQQPENSF